MSKQLHPAVLLIGLPGVGKGTQGKLLGTIPGLFHISTGEILRSLRDDTDDGQLVADSLRRGQLIPDELMLAIWERWLAAEIEAGHYRPDEQVLLLDGIPRNLFQCERLSLHIDVLQVIYLNPPDDEPIVQRLRQRAMIEGRSDDADESIVRGRFEVYRRETAPILNFYRPDVIREIDPMGSSAEVLKRILNVLSPVIVAAQRCTNQFDDRNIPPDDAQ